MTVYDLKRHAEEMQVDFREAALCRLRFIRAEMHRLMELIDSFSDYDPTTAVVADIFFGDQFRELALEQRQIALALKRPTRPDREQITTEMIQRAREHPVDNLIQFYRGAALCFAHADSRPSLSYWRAGNKATCFVCGKRWDAIDILIQRDGFTFKDAVLKLAA